MGQACKAHYGNTAVSRLGENQGAGDWYCVLGLDLSWFCRGKFGSGSKAVKLFPDEPFLKT